MDDIYYLYIVDFILISTFLYACCKKNKEHTEDYINLPDDHKYDHDIIYAQSLYDE